MPVDRLVVDRQLEEALTSAVAAVFDAGHSVHEARVLFELALRAAEERQVDAGEARTLELVVPDEDEMLCVCGHDKEGHDTDSGLDWPCLWSGCECESFDEADE